MKNLHFWGLLIEKNFQFSSAQICFISFEYHFSLKHIANVTQRVMYIGEVVCYFDFQKTTIYYIYAIYNPIIHIVYHSI